MGEVVKVFPRMRWGTPVTVRNGGATGDKILGPADGLLFLLRWPYKKGTLYDVSVLICREALKGRAMPSRARDVFVAARLEARALNCLAEYDRLGV